MLEDHYDALKIAESSTAEDIKKAYRKRMRETHPDMGGSAAEFLRVQKAWEILGDERSKAEYDSKKGNSLFFEYQEPEPPASYRTASAENFADFAWRKLDEEAKRLFEAEERRKEKERLLTIRAQALSTPEWPFTHVGGYGDKFFSRYGAALLWGAPFSHVESWRKIELLVSRVSVIALGALNLITLLMAIIMGHANLGGAFSSWVFYSLGGSALFLIALIITRNIVWAVRWFQNNVLAAARLLSSNSTAKQPASPFSSRKI